MDFFVFFCFWNFFEHTARSNPEPNRINLSNNPYNLVKKSAVKSTSSRKRYFNLNLWIDKLVFLAKNNKQKQKLSLKYILKISYFLAIIIFQSKKKANKAKNAITIYKRLIFLKKLNK